MMPGRAGTRVRCRRCDARPPGGMPSRCQASRRGGAPAPAAVPSRSHTHKNRTLIMRRTAALLGCMPTATITSARPAPTSWSRGSEAEGASPAMASSESASSLVAAGQREGGAGGRPAVARASLGRARLLPSNVRPGAHVT